MNKPIKRFVIIAGANGTGKTTLAGEFLKEYNIKFLNADDIAFLVGKKKGQDPAKWRIRAGRKFISELDRIIKADRPVAVESTLSGKYLERIIRKVKRAGYRVSIIYFFVDSPEISLSRIHARVKAGGHDIPEQDVRRRFYRSKSNFWKIYKDIADDWTMVYNGIESPSPVGTGGDGQSKVLDETLFQIFKKGISNDK